MTNTKGMPERESKYIMGICCFSCISKMAITNFMYIIHRHMQHDKYNITIRRRWLIFDVMHTNVIKINYCKIKFWPSPRFCWFYCIDIIQPNKMKKGEEVCKENEFYAEGFSCITNYKGFFEYLQKAKVKWKFWFQMKHRA